MCVCLCTLKPRRVVIRRYKMKGARKNEDSLWCCVQVVCVCVCVRNAESRMMIETRWYRRRKADRVMKLQASSEYQQQHLHTFYQQSKVNQQRSRTREKQKSDTAAEKRATTQKRSTATAIMMQNIIMTLSLPQRLTVCISINTQRYSCLLLHIKL